VLETELMLQTVSVLKDTLMMVSMNTVLLAPTDVLLVPLVTNVLLVPLEELKLHTVTVHLEPLNNVPPLETMSVIPNVIPQPVSHVQLNVLNVIYNQVTV